MALELLNMILNNYYIIKQEKNREVIKWRNYTEITNTEITYTEITNKANVVPRSAFLSKQ